MHTHLSRSSYGLHTLRIRWPAVDHAYGARTVGTAHVRDDAIYPYLPDGTFMVCEVPPCSEWDEQREPGVLPPTFGPIVRALREARGFSLRALARRIGLHPSYLSRIETGQKPPPAAETIENLAAALEVPAETLLAVTGKVPSRMKTMLGTSTAALHFVQQAHTMGLTEAEWESLVQHLQRLRCP